MYEFFSVKLNKQINKLVYGAALATLIGQLKIIKIQT